MELDTFPPETATMSKIQFERNSPEIDPAEGPLMRAREAA
jgi:hypothetical protein